jgi:hypothetical protein
MMKTCKLVVRHAFGASTFILVDPAAEVVCWQVKELCKCSCYYYYYCCCHYFLLGAEGESVGSEGWEFWMVSMAEIPMFTVESLNLHCFQTVTFSQYIIYLFFSVNDGNFFFLKWKITLEKFLYPLLVIFYSTWLTLIDIFHPHGIHFLLTLKNEKSSLHKD